MLGLEFNALLSSKEEDIVYSTLVCWCLNATTSLHQAFTNIRLVQCENYCAVPGKPVGLGGGRISQQEVGEELLPVVDFQFKNLCVTLGSH